jgi:mannose-1-phosphate guanylyltransferase
LKALLLAAGYGTRLRPITYTLPKVMVPVANRPLIAWAMDSLLAAKAKEVIVNLHHIPERIEHYLEMHYQGRLALRFSHEKEILGTGGALRRVRRWLESEKEVFIINADTIQLPRYDELRRARSAHDAIAALGLRHPPARDRFTAVWFEDGLVTGFGSGTGEPLMFGGSHLVASRIFEHLPDREAFGIVSDVYQPLLEEGRASIAGIVEDGLWFDIGTLPRYLSASHALRAAIVRGEIPPPDGSLVRGDSLLHTTSSADHLTRSTIGARSTIRGEAVDSVIWEDCAIRPGVRLKSCIVTHGVEITRPQSLKNVLLSRDTPGIPGEYRRKDGVVVARIED